MTSAFSLPRTGAALLAAIAMLGTVAWAQQAPTVRIRGTVEVVDGPMLTIKTREGDEAKVKMTDNITVIAIAKTSLAEINIVPLVDVVLVLLIIFMLTAHVMDFGLQVEVPKVKPVKENVQDLQVVSISKDGASYLNDKPVNINLLADEIHKRFHNASSVYLRADRRMPFDPIAQVIATLGQAKLAVSVVTQPEDLTDKRR